MNPIFIGISGHARAGKDSVADIIRKDFNFVKISFASSLKDAAAIIYGLSPSQLNGEDKSKIDPFWGKTPREILQNFGIGLRATDPDVWVKSAIRKGMSLYVERIKAYSESYGARPLGIVIPDTRFKNEAEAIKDRGGVIIRVIRKDLPDPDAEWRKHQSEIDLDDWPFDHHITSPTFTGSSEKEREFKEMVHQVMFSLLRKQGVGKI